jgi:hypothetical protein
MRETGAQLLEEGQSAEERGRRVLTQQGGQRVAGDVLHRHERTTFVLAHVEHDDDVRMPKAGH